MRGAEPAAPSPGRSSASRSISTRAASTGSTSTTATATCAWCSRPSAASPPSAAIPTTSSSRAGAWTCRCCAPTAPTASRRPRRISCTLRPRGRMPASWCSWPAIPAATDRLLTVAQLRDAARRRPAPLAAAGRGAAWPLHPVRQERRRKRRASSRIRSTPWRTPSRCAASSSTRCSMTGCCRPSATRRRRCAPRWPPIRSSRRRPATRGPTIAERTSSSARELYLPYTYLEHGAGFNSHAVPLCAHAGARRRRTRQAQHRAAARVQRRGAAARAAAPARAACRCTRRWRS